MVGKQLGRYKLVEEIGQGGMAVVYRGLDGTLNREVAVKVLHSHLSRKETNRARFAREAKVVAALKHENIVEIYDFDAGDESFIVTEYIRGRTLADFLEQNPGPMPVEVAVLALVEIAGAVAHAHQTGVIHRDIKPENVMIRQDGLIKLMDFGIARIADESGSTMTGALLGSPQFMSPEQVQGAELDARSDLFSLGVLLHRLVTGTLPFDAPNPAAILRAILETEPTDPASLNPLVGRALAAAITRALAKDPRERTANAGELIAELRSAIADAEMGPPRDELRAWFADPEGYARVLRGKLVARYTDAGRARAKAGDVPAAMELWSRVLEMDPSNADVRSALDRLGRGRRNRRLVLSIGAGAASVLLLGTAGVRGWRALQAWTPAPPPSPTAVAIDTVSPAPSPVATPSARPSAKPAARPSPIASDVAAGPSPSPTTVAMLLRPPIPAGMGVLQLAFLEVGTISIDGMVVREVPGVPEADGMTLKLKNRDIPLAPGDHALLVTASSEKSGCQPLSGKVHIEAGSRTTSVVDASGRTLRREDGQIYLRGCKTAVKIVLPAGFEAATVVVDGKAAGVTGVPFDTTSGMHDLKLVRGDGHKARSIFHTRPDSPIEFRTSEEPLVVAIDQANLIDGPGSD